MAQEAEAGTEKKKLPIVKILLTVVGSIVLMGVGAGATFMYFKLTAPPDDNPFAIELAKKEAEAAKADAGHGEAKADAGHGEAKKEGGGHGEAAPAGPAGKPVPSKEQFATTYFEFPGNFTSNLKGSRRFMQISIGLATQYDKKVIENVQKHEVAIRSEVLTVLAEQTEADVSGLENRKRIQILIKDTINKVLNDITGFGGIENVYVTALVMQ
ncbi:MAG: flagellar biosynthesis protein FliL [Alphaproteobacteria bacterium]|nr:flagellar biosynthesis protein FliL [Alphaproteobacteria bacterium]